MFDFIVVGKGLIGSAATRYLSQISGNVAVIGPDEPQNWQTHNGVFGSHYDQGRITRILDSDPVWARLAKNAIAQYRTIEAQSGISFYQVTGGLQAGPLVGQVGEELAQTEIVGKQFEAEFETYPPGQLKQASPFFEFPHDTGGLLERGVAGYINPRSLIKAQLAIAVQNGATIIPKTVASINTRNGSVRVTTVQGDNYAAQKVLIAAGAYTNSLLHSPLDLILKPRTILMARLPQVKVKLLANLPTLIYWLPSHPTLTEIYMLPPIQYPDGNYYIKIGGGLKHLQEASSYTELRRWFQSDGSNVEADALKEVLLSLLPQLNALSFQAKPCVTTYTSTHRPYIDTIEAGRIFVATGGCGASAKSSNEIGRLAASLVEHNSWVCSDFDAADFKLSST